MNEQYYTSTWTWGQSIPIDANIKKTRMQLWCDIMRIPMHDTSAEHAIRDATEIIEAFDKQFPTGETQ